MIEIKEISEDDNSMTLTEAKQWLKERLDEGTRCPCCNQYAKIYKRKI